VRTCGPSRLLGLLDQLQQGATVARAADLDRCA
jgi:hypothetical protein